MADGRIHSRSNFSSLLQDDKLSLSTMVLHSLWIPATSSSFQGSKAMVNFENVNGSETADTSIFIPLNKEENDDEDCDGCSRQTGKKRRLSLDQVEFLERNFELENKLEPDRKIELAKELGLQPRQVAIWFQNRRARFKTKQLEKDYDSLKSVYDKLKDDYDNLLKEQENLKTKVNAMKEKLVSNEKEKRKLEPFEAINPSVEEHENPNLSTVSDNLMVCKQEDASSAKSDVFDSESPHCTQNLCPLMETDISSDAFEPEQSDFSQDEEDNFNRSLFPKMEDDCYCVLPSESCNFGFLLDDQPFCFWPSS